VKLHAMNSYNERGIFGQGRLSFHIKHDIFQ